MSARDPQERLHPTCIEVTPRPGVPREWLCGPECPRGPRTVVVKISQDAARDARVAARRAADARKAGAAIDRLFVQARTETYYHGWSDGYAASEVHHNGHYGVATDRPGANAESDSARANSEPFYSTAAGDAGDLYGDTASRTISPHYGVAVHCGAKAVSSERLCELDAGHDGDHFTTLAYGSTLTWAQHKSDSGAAS